MTTVMNTPEKQVFEMKIDVSLANAIRRSVWIIPTMAIDIVEISKNDSPLYDETLAHRMGLIPLKMDKSFKSDSTCILKMDVTREGTIYSGDFKGNCEIVYDKIPLTLINKNQRIKVKATTKIGCGVEHAKFLPGVIFYRNICEITMDKQFENVIKEAFPNNKITVKGSKIVILDNLEKPIVDFCEGLAQKEKKKADVVDTGKLLFTVESFGPMKAAEIFKQAVDTLKKELKAIPKFLK